MKPNENVAMMARLSGVVAACAGLLDSVVARTLISNVVRSAVINQVINVQA